MAAIDKACPFCRTSAQQTDSVRVHYHCGTTAHFLGVRVAQSDKCWGTCLQRKLQAISEAVKAARRFEAEPQEDSIRYEEYELGSLTDATILDRIDDILRG